MDHERWMVLACNATYSDTGTATPEGLRSYVCSRPYPARQATFDSRAEAARFSHLLLKSGRFNSVMVQRAED